VISVVQLGTVSYSDGLRLQQKLVELRKSGSIGDVLLLLEHTPVITLGRNAKAANILMPAEQLAIRGVEVFETDRGGDVTFHGPGQIVGYPIFDLRGFERSQVLGVGCQEKPGGSVGLHVGRRTLGAVDQIRCLEEVLIRTCADFRIAAKRVAGLTGVWAETSPEAKIAAIGVHISRSVTSHGFALNHTTDLSYFQYIVPCGITKPVTSMRDLGVEAPREQVVGALARNFSKQFQRELIHCGHERESSAAVLTETFL